MKFIILAVILAIGPCSRSGAQPPAALKPLRIADSLTPKEMTERNPVLLRSELDSLVKLYAAPVIPEERKADKPSEGPAPYNLLLAGTGLLLLISLLTLFLIGRQQQAGRLQRLLGGKDTGEGGRNEKQTTLRPEEMVGQEQPEPGILSKEKESLQKQAGEFSDLQRNYAALIASLEHTFKLRHYKGYKPGISGAVSYSSVLDTEKAIADQSFEKFLKPLLAIADSNKNHPARLSKADQEKMIELLISLSFLYIEYLYLRVGDLVIGGTIVERLAAFAAGTRYPEVKLKALNTESGSRALVLRLALDKASVGKLSYPVFDETNLNKS